MDTISVFIKFTMDTIKFICFYQITMDSIKSLLKIAVEILVFEKYLFRRGAQTRGGLPVQRQGLVSPPKPGNSPHSGAQRGIANKPRVNTPK